MEIGGGQRSLPFLLAWRTGQIYSRARLPIAGPLPALHHGLMASGPSTGTSELGQEGRPKLSMPGPGGPGAGLWRSLRGTARVPNTFRVGVKGWGGGSCSVSWRAPPAHPSPVGSNHFKYIDPLLI